MLVRFHISSQVRSLVTGSPVACSGRAGLREAVPIIIISCTPWKGMTAGFDADHGVGPDRAGLGDDPLQGEVAGGVEDVAELLDLAAAQALEPAEQAAADADRIGHVAEDELDRHVAGVELAVEFLAVAAGGKQTCCGRVLRRRERRRRRRGTRCCRETAAVRWSRR